MVRTQLISSTYLKDNTVIEYNVDDAKIDPMIFKAQDIYIAPLLGSDMYEDLMIKAAPSGTLTPAEEKLIRDYIQPALAEYTHYILINQLRSKITNKSLSNENSNYSMVAERADAKDLRNEVRDMAEFYAQRLVKHLCTFSTAFPLYNSPTATENMHRNSKTYFSGVYIKRKRR